MSNMSEVSIPHSMIKLLLQLSVTPTQPGKHSNVHSMMMMSEDATSQETSSDREGDTASDVEEEEDDLEYAAIEEERKLWMSAFDDADSDSDSNGGDTDNECEQKQAGDELKQQSLEETATETDTVTEIDTEREVMVVPPTPLHDPFFQAGGGDLPYGGHISLHSHRHAAHYPQQGTHTPGAVLSSRAAGGGGSYSGCSEGRDESDEVISNSSCYSTSLLCPLPLSSNNTTGVFGSAYAQQSVLCQEDEVCMMVTDMLLGNSSDFFHLAASDTPDSGSPSSFVHPMLTANRTFSITPTASHSRLVHMSSETLNSLLAWFVSLSNQVQVVRNYVMVDFCVLRREHYLHVEESMTRQRMDARRNGGIEREPNHETQTQTQTQTLTCVEESHSDTSAAGRYTYHPTALSERMQASVQQALRPPLEQLQAEVAIWQRRVLACNGCDELGETADVTLLLMYVALRKTWQKVMRLASHLTSQVSGLDFVPPASVGDGDLTQHEHVLALMQQLLRENNTLQLLHCHAQLSLLPFSSSSSFSPPSVVSAESLLTRHHNTTEGNDNDSNTTDQPISTLHLHLKLCDSQHETNFLRTAFFSFQAEYLNSLLAWLHSTGGGGALGGTRTTSSSDSELMGGFGGLHTRGNLMFSRLDSLCVRVYITVCLLVGMRICLSCDEVDVCIWL